MVHLLWGGLNAVLSLAFVFVCFKATGLVKERIGIVAAIIFAFGLISFIGGSGSDPNRDSKKILSDTYMYVSRDSINMASLQVKEITLEKAPFFEYKLVVQYAKDKNNRDIVYTNAYTYLARSAVGSTWSPVAISVYRTNESGVFSYDVLSTVQWALLGSTYYVQSKSWEGTVALR